MTLQVGGVTMTRDLKFLIPHRPSLRPRRVPSIARAIVEADLLARRDVPLRLKPDELARAVNPRLEVAPGADDARLAKLGAVVDESAPARSVWVLAVNVRRVPWQEGRAQRRTDFLWQ